MVKTMLKEIITKWLDKGKVVVEHDIQDEEYANEACNQAIEDLKSRIPELEKMILKEIVGTILKSFEELNQSDYPMAIIHWSKKDREEWIINTLKGGNK